MVHSILRLEPIGRLAKEYAQGPGWLHSCSAGESHTELEEDLRETLGEEAAIGLYRDYRPESDNELIAYVPMPMAP